MHGLLRRFGVRWCRVTTAFGGHKSTHLGEPTATHVDKLEAPICWSDYKVAGLRVDYPSWKGVAAILSVLTVVRIWAASRVGLAPDEAYYWLWSQTPALGYSDHPPMVAWWIWLSTRVLGDTAIGVRMPPILSALVTSLAVFGTARQLFSPYVIALRAVLWFNAMILIGVGAIFSTPDAPSTMFWALAVWALSAVWRSQRPWLWLLVGLFAGLGCVAKYTNFFLGPGILVWLFTDFRARRWLYSPWLWSGGLIAFVVFVPVLLWNAQHGWISFAKQFGRLAAHQISLRYLGEFLLSQVGLLNPIIAYFCALGAAVTFTRRTEAQPNPYLPLLATMAPLGAYMIVHAFHDRVQANWLAPIYPQLAILAAACAEDQLALPRRVWLARAVVPLGVAISVVSLFYLAAPVQLPLPFRSPVDRLEGWQDLAAGIERLRRQSGAGWIATANYDINAELAFYEHGRQPVREIFERERYSSSPLDVTLINQPALLVLSEGEKISERFDRCFALIDPISMVSRRGAGGLIDRYIVERVEGAPGDIISAGCHAKIGHHQQ
jgi:Dolichyl-phosphate-mannose-protein mannosyltransferase